MRRQRPERTHPFGVETWFTVTVQLIGDGSPDELSAQIRRALAKSIPTSRQVHAHLGNNFLPSDKIESLIEVTVLFGQVKDRVLVKQVSEESALVTKSDGATQARVRYFIEQTVSANLPSGIEPTFVFAHRENPSRRKKKEGPVRNSPTARLPRTSYPDPR